MKYRNEKIGEFEDGNDNQNQYKNTIEQIKYEKNMYKKQPKTLQDYTNNSNILLNVNIDDNEVNVIKSNKVYFHVTMIVIFAVIFSLFIIFINNEKFNNTSAFGVFALCIFINIILSEIIKPFFNSKNKINKNTLTFNMRKYDIDSIVFLDTNYLKIFYNNDKSIWCEYIQTGIVINIYEVIDINAVELLNSELDILSIKLKIEAYKSYIPFILFTFIVFVIVAVIIGNSVGENIASAIINI